MLIQPLNSILRILLISTLCFFSISLVACGGSSGGTSQTQVVNAIDSDGDGVPDSNDNCSGTPAGTKVDAHGCPPQIEDVQVEAEDYNRFFDTTTGNEGNIYRTDDVDIEACTDLGGGYNLGWMDVGEWLEYDIQLSAGTYVVTTRLASAQSGGIYNLYLDAELIAHGTVADTGGWQNFVSQALNLVTVSQSGDHILRLEVESGPFNLNWISFTVDDGTFTAPAPLPAEPPIALPARVPVVDPNPVSPATAVSQMGIGINLGNTLDAPHEGDWAPSAQQQYFHAFKTAGFKHVRIPVTWDNHITNEAPYTIDETFLDRVETVVDWALAEDLYVILNAHHEAWIKTQFSDQRMKNRFDSLWIQISDRFKYKSAKLLFEILNEPNGMSIADIDAQNVRTLSIIRNANPTRLVIFSGNDYTPIDALLAAAIPDSNDAYLIGNFHNYEPWAFAGQCQRGWGSEADKTALEAIYQQAADWSLLHDIPVTVNEFGAAKYDFTLPDNVCNTADRLAYLEAHVTLATRFGIAATFWDDGGAFSSYDRDGNTWGPEKDVLVAPNLTPAP